LYARVGDPYCPDHPEQKLAAMPISQMLDATLSFPEDTKLMILAPVVVNRTGEQLELLVELRATGSVRGRVDGKVYGTAAAPKLACPSCNYSLSELEPRLFSFNNPLGACPRCDGLGAITFFDPKRVVAFPQLSLASGTIKGWDRRNQFYFQMLQSLAKHVGFDVDRPFAKLPERVQNVILS